MSKFKRKSEEVEAFKWILGSTNTPRWFYQAFEKGTIWLDESLNSMNRKGEVKKTICIKYRNGVIRATNGDFIIKDSEGKIYSCTCGEFEKYYEDLEDEKLRLMTKIHNEEFEYLRRIPLKNAKFTFELIGIKEDE
ncbi:hypothetical protein RYE12_18385 [Clostridioides difficile]|uniref:hypothetical protein n=1 Tax=unclassified Clostridioides TaxID=2635829 RepID=UPI001D12DAE9|nr:hypothetical protein [Clostridioides difficile]MCC0707380.1 hypothetical protein [Clostridioides sp. ES-S-0190-01]MDS6237120.1 hypothetical protein [Clostridioides difficile]MDU8900831.1 hypothetical protein [Clostridioides difficile]UDN58249.1 hypothetical protein JJC01_19170 [Clostridioides sp. ES-S-0010-02]